MIKRNILVPAFATFAIVASLPSEAARGDRGARNLDPEAKVERIFNKLDTDGSGIITLSEWTAKPAEKAAQMFARADSDDDGLISLEEFLDRGSDRRRGRPGRPDFDEIDRDELRACVEAATGETLPERPEPEARFDAIDTSDDGFIDLDELTAAKVAGATEKFERIDTDDDAGVSMEEMLAALEAKQDRREIRRACVDEQRDMLALTAE